MHTSLPSDNPVVSLDALNLAKVFLSFGGFHTQGLSGYLVRAASCDVQLSALIGQKSTDAAAEAKVGVLWMCLEPISCC